MAKIIDWFPKIIFCKIPEIIMLMIPNAGIIKTWTAIISNRNYISLQSKEKKYKKPKES